MPFSLYLILDPYTQGRLKEFPLDDLKEFHGFMLKIKETLSGMILSNITIYKFEERFKESNKIVTNDLTESQKFIMNECFSFYEQVCNEKKITREQLRKFCRKLTPTIKQNMR